MLTSIPAVANNMSRLNLLAVSLAITTFIIGLEAAPTFNHHSHGHNAAFSRLLHRHQHHALRSEHRDTSVQDPASADSSVTAEPTEDVQLPTENLPLLHIGPEIEAPVESRYVDDTGL